MYLLFLVCGNYLSTYPADTGLFWEVDGVGGPFQRTQIASKILEMGLKSRESVPHDVPMEEVMTQMQETVEYTVEVVVGLMASFRNSLHTKKCCVVLQYPISLLLIGKGRSD